MGRARIGTVLIDTTDGRECIISGRNVREETLLRKQDEYGCWKTLIWKPGRFKTKGSPHADAALRRLKKREEAIEKYGLRLIQLAEANGLRYEQAAAAIAE